MNATVSLLTPIERMTLRELASEAAAELAGTENEKRTAGVEWRRAVLSKRLLLLTRLAQENE